MSEQRSNGGKQGNMKIQCFSKNTINVNGIGLELFSLKDVLYINTNSRELEGLERKLKENCLCDVCHSEVGNASIYVGEVNSPVDSFPMRVLKIGYCERLLDNNECLINWLEIKKSLYLIGRPKITSKYPLIIYLENGEYIIINSDEEKVSSEFTLLSPSKSIKKNIKKKKKRAKND
jgi:hypothetical protein